MIDYDDLLLFGKVILTFMLLMCAIFQMVYMYENVSLRVSLDGKEVFHGRSACVETQSVGSSSRVDTKKGPWCLFPKEYFAGKDLVITTEDK